MLRELPRQPRVIGVKQLRERLLAAGYVVDIRTVQRDLVNLSRELALYGDDKKPQGWAWLADAPQLDFPALEPEAALVFHLAEKNLKPLLPTSTLNLMAPWFRMASNVLDQQTGGLAAWRDKVRVLAPGLPAMAPAIADEVQTIVTQALLLNRRLEVSYQPREAGAQRQYEVSPLALVLRDQMQYLVCTLREYDDIKQLALNRIQSAWLLEKPARSLPGFNIDTYIAQGEFGYSQGPAKSLRLEVEIDKGASLALTERPLHADQLMEDIDEQKVRLKVSVPDTTEMRRWLLGFGPHARVLQPLSLRMEMRAIIAQMMQRYDG